MTREEALEVIKSHPFLFASFPDDVIEALDVLIKQEPVIDKIRAEVEEKIRPWLDFEDRERDRNDAFLEVLDIIDKYKKEQEGA